MDIVCGLCSTLASRELGHQLPSGLRLSSVNSQKYSTVPTLDRTFLFTKLIFISFLGFRV